MGSNNKPAPNAGAEAAGEACPLDAPLTGRVPGFLALAVLPAAGVLNPLFIALAAGLLATLSLLLSGPGCRLLGVAGLLGSLTVGAARLL
ncbi:MAG TPA: hypothetical protein DIC36_02475 [Gammaproteobacteria bacterium]|nr:hypothetical protein [Gammaproteobacteria bacterium]